MIQESVLSGKFIMTRQLILQGIAFVVKLKDFKKYPFRSTLLEKLYYEK